MAMKILCMIAYNVSNEAGDKFSDTFRPSANSWQIEFVRKLKVATRVQMMVDVFHQKVLTNSLMCSIIKTR